MPTDASAAKGSAAGCCDCGDLKADEAWGWGVPDCDAAGDVKEEKAENVFTGTLPLALLLSVTDESNAGPGISVLHQHQELYTTRTDRATPPEGCQRLTCVVTEAQCQGASLAKVPRVAPD